MEAEAAQAAEDQLRADLRRIDTRLLDERFMADLYRALAGNRWRKSVGAGVAVSLSWARAEELVNELRRSVDQPELELRQTGREGEVSATVNQELAAIGWTAEAVDTGQRDESHLGTPPSPPPGDQGARQAPHRDDTRWSGLAEGEG